MKTEYTGNPYARKGLEQMKVENYRAQHCENLDEAVRWMNRQAEDGFRLFSIQPWQKIMLLVVMEKTNVS